MRLISRKSRGWCICLGILPLFFGFNLSPIHAFEAYPLIYETVRARGMGGAMLGIPEDEQVVLVNPAALGTRVKRAYAVADVNAEMNQGYRAVKNETDRLSSENTPEGRAFNNNVLSRVMGKKARLQASNFAYYLGKEGFGGGVLMQNTAELAAVRSTNPKVLDLQVSDIVLSGSFARPVPDPINLFSDKTRGWWGGTLKILSRGYINREFDARDFAGLSEKALNDDRFNGIAGDIDFGTFWALDNPWAQTIGLSAGNIIGSEIDPNIGRLKQWVSLGTAIKPLSGPSERKQKLTLAADLWDLSDDNSFFGKLRLGMEGVVSRWLTIRGGVRGGYLSGGFTASFRMMKFDFATYSEESGPRPGDKEDRRYSVSLSMNF